MDGLREHLQERYGVGVTALSRLDRGVLKVAREDGSTWVARVFPAERPLREVEGDATVLRALERAGFPAERCADDRPVSRLAGRGVLVTEFVAGDRAAPNGRSFAILGALLGRLHAQGAAGTRAGGAWHHLAPAGGGPRAELDGAAAILRAAPARSAEAARLLEELAALDDGAALPHAFVHPDPTPPNAIVTGERRLTIVDWTNAGRGPRVWSLAFLLWAAGARHPRILDATVERYRRHSRLDADERAALAEAIRARPLLLDVWAIGAGRRSFEDAVAALPKARALAQEIAARALAAA